jgi:hypothetical protein
VAVAVIAPAEELYEKLELLPPKTIRLALMNVPSTVDPVLSSGSAWTGPVAFVLDGVYARLPSLSRYIIAATTRLWVATPIQDPDNVVVSRRPDGRIVTGRIGRETGLDSSITCAFDNIAPYQNMSFSANWIWREVVAVPVMSPAEELMLFPENTTAFGSEKFV